MRDPRPTGRLRDPQLLRRLHLEWDCCAICGLSDTRLSLHHVLKNPRQDIREAIVMLCGDGVAGCHGKIEANDPEALAELAQHIVDERPDVIDHLIDRLGEVPAWYWINRRLRSVGKHE